MCLAREWAPPNAEVHTDCASVVHAALHPQEAVAPRRPMAGLWMLHPRRDLQVCKTKAHRTRAEAEAQGDVTTYLGNDLADRCAKTAAMLLTNMPHEVQKHNDHAAQVKDFWRGVIVLWQQWPSFDEAVRLGIWKVPPPRAQLPGRRFCRRPHSLEWHEGLHRYTCTVCFRKGRDVNSRPKTHVEARFRLFCKVCTLTATALQTATRCGG